MDIDGKLVVPEASFVPECLEEREYTTVIVEVAFSEPDAYLHDKVNFWLRKSNGAVQTVIIIRVKAGDRRKVVLQRWCMNNGAIVMEQETVVEKQYGKTRPPQAEIRVTNDPFVIPFDKVYLRQRTRSARDIRITGEGLEELVGGR